MAPIIAFAIATFAVVAATLAIGARETDEFALERGRDTIRNAISQHALSLARELRVQTVWTEAYDKTRALDVPWMRSLYGIYLSQLLGYDRIYVLDSNNEQIFGFAPGAQATSTSFSDLGDMSDLVRALRESNPPPGDKVVVTDVSLAGGQIAEHRAIADVRRVDGHPATVVVSTILPDRGSKIQLASAPFLLIAIEDLDKTFTKRLGSVFGFTDLRWISEKPESGDASVSIVADNGRNVGTLAWRLNRPSIEFMRHISLGVALSLALLAALALLIMQWSRQQTRRLTRSEAIARLAARTDSLTGLPNRRALGEMLPRLLAERTKSQSTLGVVAIDLDGFAEINDSFSTGVGDAVLRVVGERLHRLLMPLPILARHGGDDFVLLAPGLDADQLAEFANDVVCRLSEPVVLEDGTHILITASAGYALAPGDGDTPEALIRRSELALKRAKEKGGLATGFTPQLELESNHRRELEHALRKAVADNAISVAYQPIMESSGSLIAGVEALARWTDPTLGVISPDIFIPLAEETGLILKLGAAVLRRAVSDAAEWPGVKIAVNVSATQIHHGDVVAVVEDVLTSSGFPPCRLEIEITESVLMSDKGRANAQIRGLQALGVGVGLDDFGSGFASLHYLGSFGFNKLKIDRSFLRGIDDAGEGEVVLASIIKLGLDLDMALTAEGVETEQQRLWLEARGVHQMQGYLFARPMSASQLGRFIALHSPRTSVATSGLTAA